MATESKRPANLASLVEAGERSAVKSKREARVKLAEDERTLATGDGVEIGTFALATYHPRNGEPIPVVVEKIGGIERMLSLITVRAAAEAYFG